MNPLKELVRWVSQLKEIKMMRYNIKIFFLPMSQKDTLVRVHAQMINLRMILKSQKGLHKKTLVYPGFFY